MAYPAGDVRMPGRSRSRKAISGGLFIFVSIALHSTCYASLVAFDTESSFLQTGLAVSTETFDELPPDTVVGTETAVLDGITYASDQPLAQWIAGIHTHQVPPQFMSPPNDFGASLISDVTLTFENGGSSDAIGFYILTAGAVTTYNIFITTTDGERYLEPLIFEPNPSFRGFVSPEGITSVEVAAAFTGSQLNYSFDNVSRGQIVAAPVPEPWTVLLFAGGLALLAICAHFKKYAGSSL